MTNVSTKTPPHDNVCEQAQDLAHSALLEEVDESLVGQYRGSQVDGVRLVSHYFECLDPAYVGWQWSVSVTRAPRARKVTICEIVLLPTDDALLAPEWHPWSERVEAGDLGVGDLLPADAQDERLEPGYTGIGDNTVGVGAAGAHGPGDMQTLDEVPLYPLQWELGLGRKRVLSVFGRDQAYERWEQGETGPDAAMAKAAPESCFSCGFLLPIGGLTGQNFGVCANEYSPADGQVVSMTYGCGAHSEIKADGRKVSVVGTVVDDDADVVLEAVLPAESAAAPAQEGQESQTPGSTDEADEEPEARASAETVGEATGEQPAHQGEDEGAEEPES